MATVHQLLHLVTTLSLLTVAVTYEHYHIVPIGSTHLCQKYPDGTCFILDELATRLDNHDSDELVISFLPGEHSLSVRIKISDVHKVSLNRESLSTVAAATISCVTVGSAGFEFENIYTELRFEQLKFSLCKQKYSNGGAVSMKNVGYVLIDSCSFSKNSVTSKEIANLHGGALYMENIHDILILTCTFDRNWVSDSESDGGAVYISGGNVHSSCKVYHSRFTMNMANNTGGAIAYYGNNNRMVYNINILNSTFSENRAIRGGGAVYISNVLVSIVNCTLVGNIAGGQGGAVWVVGTNVLQYAYDVYVFNSTNSRYMSNSASHGGAISANVFIVNTLTSTYIQNKANLLGGAIYSYGISVISKLNTYSYNNASSDGGAVCTEDSLAQFKDDHFLRNAAQRGAAIFLLRVFDSSQNNIHNSRFTGNTHTHNGNGVVFLQLSKLMINGTVVFSNNLGSLYAFNSPVEFTGYTLFTNNTCELGGGFTSVQSTITLQLTSTTSITYNKAKYGGGVSLSESSLFAFGTIVVSNNRALVSGGGMYAHQSTIEFRPKDSSLQQDALYINITNNTAEQDGGGLFLTALELKISSCFVYISSNIAVHGGGVFLEQFSRIDLYKSRVEQNSAIQASLNLFDNVAFQGGALYVSDSTNSGVLCRGAKIISTQEFTSAQCFIQSIQLYKSVNKYAVRNFVNFYFWGNTAIKHGSAIYGGLLDRCTISLLAEVLHKEDKHIPANGLEYLLDIAQFGWAKNGTAGHISSDPVRLCFCINNGIYCNYTHSTVSVKKGELFSVRVAAVDQVGSPVKATIISVFSSKKGIGRLKEGQEYQHIEDHCTDLKYNVYSMDNTAELQLYADGPCSNMGISKRNLNITFLPCICPIGFQRSPSQIDCGCVCDVRLRPYVSHCSPENETIQIDTKVWIEYINTTNNSGFVIQTCPYDYCVDKPVNISLNTSYNVDKQCAYDRVGVLCGECEEGLSLVFASSRCKECSHYFLLLILPFALAGIALVLLILLLNMTVATGTINGLIFYVNILAANRSIFLPFDSPNVLTVFISWLNLDLGIATCFYHGMNSYGKVLLQLVFPVYLFILIGIIIALCERSQRLSTLLGKKNPVATLCTLILLSYSKLIRTIISSLQLTVLDYPDGSREIVWLYDANVQYFSASHIPRFIAAFIIIILGGVYTTLLLFGQVFNLCSEFKFMKWVSHPKYDSFIKEYHAPLADKHRYWVGLLLLARIIHFLISAFATEPIVILSAGTIAFGLVLLKLLNKTIYKNWLLDTLETSFLVNLVFLSLSTFYIRDGAVGRDQSTLANTSMAISFITFLGIVLYHSFAKLWVKAGVLYQRARDAINKRRPYEPAPDEDLDQEDLSDNDELPFEPETIQNYTDNNSDRPNTPPTYHTQPIIRRVVRDDQLREPALDDLIPVQPEDYIVSRPARPRRQQMTTYSEVDIGFDRENNSND